MSTEPKDFTPDVDVHLFVCTNTREVGESCGPLGAAKLRDEVKALCKRPEWKGRVRVNAAGCLGRCHAGIAAVIYPKGEWFESLTGADAGTLVQAVERAMGKK